MHTNRSVKLVKQIKLKVAALPIKSQVDVQPNMWSTAVKSWVVEFRQRRELDSHQAFDSLFK